MRLALTLAAMGSGAGPHLDRRGGAELEQVRPRHVGVVLLDLFHEGDGGVEARVRPRGDLAVVLDGAVGAALVRVLVVRARIVPR